MVFNLSDSSLSGYDFKIYYDQEFKNNFVSSQESTVFSISTSAANGTVGAALTIGYGTTLPESLFYNLEKSGTISTTDKDVKDYSKISFNDSVYNGSYTISGVGATTFNIFLDEVPEKLTYNLSESDVLKYNTSSKNAKGSISNIKSISSGSNYKKLPTFQGIVGSSTGKDAVIVPQSKTIGNI